MKPVPQPKEPSGARFAPAGDVLRHLADSLHTQGRRYRKRLQQCQEKFSEEAVHETRVAARRLLATIELLGAFLPHRKLEKARDVLKQHLDTFDPLRDTQVQLVYVGRMTRAFPAARAFRDWLHKRENRFTRDARQAIKGFKTKRFARRLAAFEAEICQRRKDTSRGRADAAVLRVVTRACARVARLSRGVAAADTATIHRARIAFKRYRYMTEALAPLLPAITEQHRQALRGYQSMMGDIQDLEVMLAALDKFLHRKEINTAAAGRLRNELLRRRQWLIQVYLNATAEMPLLWPPPGQRAQAARRQVPRFSNPATHRRNAGTH